MAEQNIVAMNRDEQEAALASAADQQELDNRWAELEAVGYSKDGLLYRVVLTRQAQLNGEPEPTFPEPPGKNLPPITGGLMTNPNPQG